jgi:hypothetical protein
MGEDVLDEGVAGTAALGNGRFKSTTEGAPRARKQGVKVASPPGSGCAFA